MLILAILCGCLLTALYGLVWTLRNGTLSAVAALALGVAASVGCYLLLGYATGLLTRGLS